MTTLANVYQPRMAMTLFVPTLGTSTQRVAQENDSTAYRLDVRPIRARHVANSIHEADELDVTFTYDEAGMDPRYLRSAEGYFYLADTATSGGVLTPDISQNLRFVGIARDVTRSFSESAGNLLTMRFQDYTCLFLECKVFPASKMPLLSDTLPAAWAKMCANTGYWDLTQSPPAIQSTVSVLSDRITFVPDSLSSTTLGSAMPPRLAKLGKVQPEPGADAWAIWKSICDALGLITYIRNDRCVVTTATDFYTYQDPPLFIYGGNILELTETRELGSVSAKGVCARSYNPLTATTLESFYPPINSTGFTKKRNTASATKAPTTIKTPDYELLDLPFATADQTTNDTIAQRIWEERVRQELHGTLTTREMAVASVSGASRYDLLALGSGDALQVVIDRGALDSVQSQTTLGARVAMLLARGYSSDAATFIASNLDSIDKLPGQFLVRSVETTFDASSATGEVTYESKIEFCNRVSLSGDGSVTIQATDTPQITGTSEPPVTGQTTTEAA